MDIYQVRPTTVGWELEDQQSHETVLRTLTKDEMYSALDAFMDSTQKTVSGVVRVRFYKGQVTVTGMKSPQSIYREDLATYSEGDTFDHQSAVGFIKVWGLPIKTWRQVHGETVDAEGCAEVPTLKKASGLDG